MKQVDDVFERVHRADCSFLLRREMTSELLKALERDSGEEQVIERSSYGGRGLSEVLVFAGGRALLRRYWHGGIFRGLTRDYILQRRVLHEMWVTEAIRKRGGKVPLILGAIFRPLLWPFYRATLILREIEEALDLAAYLRSGSAARRTTTEKREVLDRCARQVRLLHDVDIIHGDLHIKNILVQPKQNPQVYLLDFDKARIRQPLSTKARVNNLLRLKRSVDKLRFQHTTWLRQTDELRFLYAYGGQDQDFLNTFWPAYRRYRRFLPLRRLWWRIVYG